MTQKEYKHICFTSFNTDLEWFKDWTQGKEFISYIIIQGEYTKDGKKHIQGYSQFVAKKRLETIKRYFKDTTLHIEQPLGTPEQASNYCKQEKNGKFREYEEYGIINLELGIQGKRTDLIELRDLIKSGKRLNQIMMETEDNKTIHNILQYGKGLRELEYNVRQEKNKEEIKKEFENIVWKPWQKKIIDMLNNITDNRKIKWLYDELGNNGKSFLARYLLLNKDVYYITGGKQQDILFGYDGQPIIIYDLARTYSDNLEHIYTTIENFKNGQYLSTKYETQQRFFKIPHIIIMANFMPDINKLSSDRWDIEDINDNNDNNDNNNSNVEIDNDNNDNNDIIDIIEDDNIDKDIIDNIVIKDFTIKKPTIFDTNEYKEALLKYRLSKNKHSDHNDNNNLIF